MALEWESQNSRVGVFRLVYGRSCCVVCLNELWSYFRPNTHTRFRLSDQDYKASIPIFRPKQLKNHTLWEVPVTSFHKLLRHKPSCLWYVMIPNLQFKHQPCGLPVASGCMAWPNLHCTVFFWGYVLTSPQVFQITSKVREPMKNFEGSIDVVLSKSS